MGWFLLAMGAVLAIAAVHGIATGTVMTKFTGVDAKRAESPFYFWFFVAGYFLLAFGCAWMGYNDLTIG